MSKVTLLFYQSFGTGDYRLWTPLEGPQALLVGGLAGLAGIGTARSVDVTRCQEWREVNGAMAAAAGLFGTMGAQKLVDELNTGPKPDVEGVDKILLMTTDLDPAAARLPVQRVLRFPEMVASKIRMEISVLLERETLGTKALGEESFYDLDVVGEVIKGGRLVDNFRYRFDFPASTVRGAFLPLNIERFLYPGEYRLKVKIADSNRNAAALIDEKVVVPESPDQSLSPEEKAAREAAKSALARLVSSPNERGALTLVPIAGEFAEGPCGAGGVRERQGHAVEGALHVVELSLSLADRRARDREHVLRPVECQAEGLRRRCHLAIDAALHAPEQADSGQAHAHAEQAACDQDHADETSRESADHDASGSWDGRAGTGGAAAVMGARRRARVTA